jgi:predicted pyridoxine 5'-phosphate oxidase superfamily flavin-nucleotide-binding protein
MRNTELFHPGELAVQTRAGVREAARKTGGVIRDRMVPGMHALIERQIMLPCASVDREGNVWTSLVRGEPGFVRVVDERTLDIARDPSRLDAEDPLWRNVSADNRIGLLFIVFESRRRLRINGTVSRTQPDRLTVTVQTCYPNCPKYIQRRQATGTWLENGRQATREGHALSAELAHTIGTTDTLFVASAHPDAGADVSHRGGHPGFVQVIDDTTLRIPDYAGNNLFNTPGHLQACPHAGLLIPDFRAGQVIQLIGTPRIEWGRRYPRQTTGGTQRYWQLRIEAWRLTTLPAFPHWRFIDYTPHLPRDSVADDPLSNPYSGSRKNLTQEV